MGYERIGPHELLRGGAAREQPHRAPGRRIGERAYHQQPPVSMKRLPAIAMGLDMGRDLRAEVWRAS